MRVEELRARRRERAGELERLAADGAETPCALAQRVLVDRREVQPQAAGTLPVQVRRAPGHERDLAGEARTSRSSESSPRGSVAHRKRPPSGVVQLDPAGSSVASAPASASRRAR